MHAPKEIIQQCNLLLPEPPQTSEHTGGARRAHTHTNQPSQAREVKRSLSFLSQMAAKRGVGLLCIAAIMTLTQAQKPTWNDVTFDPSVDRRNDWCLKMGSGICIASPPCFIVRECACNDCAPAGIMLTAGTSSLQRYSQHKRCSARDKALHFDAKPVNLLTCGLRQCRL